MSESQELPRGDKANAPNDAGKALGVASSIDWDAPLRSIALAVELPFWLLMPNGHFSVSIDGASVEIAIDNTGVEIQRGSQFTRTHGNTVFLGGEDALKNATIPASGLPGGGIVRGTRTLLYLSAHACSDAVEAFFGPDGPRFQDGYRYLASLAVGQLKVVNALINAYRRATIDPFANEVTAWDLPIWFVLDPPRSQSVSCYSHLVEDWFPTVKSWGDDGKGRPVFATSTDVVATQLTSEETPGEIELLDGWSLFHRGRFGDSIRSFVTAVEVLLEAQLRRLMGANGISKEDIEARLAETRTNFEKRMHAYCELSRRRVPGPMLHPVPYVNGVRLLDEMSRTRRLRHQIVHHGHRLDQNYKKPMLRAAETTSWLFDWLSNGGGFEERRGNTSTLFFSFRTTQTPFECDVVDGRIVVVKPDYVADPVPEKCEGLLFGEVIYSEELYFRTISKSTEDGKDIEHFAQMSLFELGFGEVEDSAFAATDGPTVERFVLEVDDGRVGVYLLDSREPLGEGDVTQLSDVLDSAGQSSGTIRAILVANDQHMDDWTVRTPLSSHLDELARSRGISVLAAPELARLVVSAMRLKWSRDVIVNNILECGPGKLMPPASVLLGSAYKYWPKVGVLGIVPVPAVPVNVGDVIAIELKNQFAEATVSDVKVDDAGRMTLKIGNSGMHSRSHAKVFVLDKDRSYHVPQDNPDDATFPPMTAIAARIVHPSRK
ncbi:MAG: hypothetical protein U1E05_01455 [Patescibacteria group bacterium]|nr:hypothetical protein [Patescibacteria group bacterium]